MSLPTAFVDLKRSSFPILIELFAESDGELLATLEIPGPGAIHVPGFAQPVLSVITLGDGGRLTTASTGASVIEDSRTDRK